MSPPNDETAIIKEERQAVERRPGKLQVLVGVNLYYYYYCWCRSFVGLGSGECNKCNSVNLMKGKFAMFDDSRFIAYFYEGMSLVDWRG